MRVFESANSRNPGMAAEAAGLIADLDPPSYFKIEQAA